jgi:small-conductance mechanosensitive channel
VEPDTRIAEIEAELPKAIETIRGMKEGPEGHATPYMSLRNLEDIRRQWQLILTQLRGWQQAVDARARGLDAARADLLRGREAWRQAETLARKQKSADLAQQARAVLGDLDGTLAQADRHRSRLSSLQSQIAGQQDGIAEVLDTIAAAKGQAERLLFSIEQAPLWEAAVSHQEHLNIETQARISWWLLRASVQRFWGAYRSRVGVHLVLSLLLLGLMFFLRHRGRRWAAEDTPPVASAGILAYPISATMLIALAFGPWLYPAAPIEVFRLGFLVLPLPLVRLLRSVMPVNLRPVLYGLAALYFVDMLGALLLGDSLLHRLLLFGITLLALPGFLWAFRRGGPCATAQQAAGWRLPLWIRWVAVALLGISLVGNLLGNFSLAELLAAGTIRSAYMATLALGIVLVLEGAWRELLHTAQAARLRIVRMHEELLIRRGARLIRVAFLALWVLTSLGLFGVLEPLAAGLLAALRWRWILGTVDISLGDVLGFVAVLGISFLLSRLIRFVLDEGLLPILDLPRGVPAALSTGAHYLILVFGFYLALGAAGVDLTKFTLLAGALGVGVGFGLQNLVNNFISGIMLLFERPINPGDTIEVGARAGEVMRIGIRSTTLRTFEGADVIIPNATLISQEVVNWTLTDRIRRVEIPVGAAYGSDPQQVMQALLAVLAKYPDVLPWPKPMALFQGMGDSALNFVLRFWTGNFDGWVVLRSDVTTSVYTALREAGIEVPFPQRDLHLRSVGPGVSRVLGEAGPEGARGGSPGQSEPGGQPR